MPDERGDKTLEATPHRRQKAREEGHVAKSQDLGSAAVLLAGMVILLLSGGAVIDFLGNYTLEQLGGPPRLVADAEAFVADWNALVWGLGRHLLPILALTMLAAIVVNVAQVGFLFRPARLAPDLSRLSPVRGFGRLFSTASAARLAFGLLKVVVVAAVAFVSFYNERETILGLAALSAPQIAVYLLEILTWTTIRVALALFVLALLDYTFQRWKHEKDLMMTPQEVREEMKNLEGDPQVVARRRAVQRQLALNRLSDAVPKADVVIAAAADAAVAIRYDPDSTGAPLVVAKGSGLVAERIRQLAHEHGVVIVDKGALARALFGEVEINRPIPPDHYTAVAEVLAQVYLLQGKALPTPRREAA